MSLDTCDPVCIFTPRPSPPHSFLTPTDTGDRPYKCQHCGDQFARRSVLPSPAAPLISNPFLFLAATSFRDISTSAIPTKNPWFRRPLLHAARAHLLPAGRPLPSKLVINVSSLLCHAMGPIPVVSPAISHPLILSHACPFTQPNVCIERRDAPMSNSIARPPLSDRVIQPVLPTILQTPRTLLSAPSL